MPLHHLAAFAVLKHERASNGRKGGKKTPFKTPFPGIALKGNRSIASTLIPTQVPTARQEQQQQKTQVSGLGLDLR